MDYGKYGLHHKTGWLPHTSSGVVAQKRTIFRLILRPAWKETDRDRRSNRNRQFRGTPSFHPPSIDCLRDYCWRGVNQMARKDAMMGLRQILMRRRDALRQALAGDLSLLKELRQQNSGDVIDAALDTAQDEISSQLAEVESRELGSIEVALERMRQGDY